MDKKHMKVKKTLQILGPILLAIGLGCLITGLVSFFMAFDSFEQPSLFWMTFIGIPFIFVGSVCLMVGFKREVTRYMKNESMPVTKEALHDLKPEFKEAMDVVHGRETGKIKCPNCGTENDSDDKFCKNCGKPINNTIICPNCGEVCDPDSKFCQKCGKEL